MKSCLTFLPILAGLAIFVGGWLYDIVFAGIPYQDPTPELSARYKFHASIASGIRWFGFIVLIGGIVFAIIQRRRRKTDSH